MKTLPLILAATLALSACGDRLGGAGGVNDDGFAGGAAGANGAIVPGSANDPASPAYFQARVGDRVLFAVDQSTITPEGQATLRGQAEWLNANPSYTALIEGHADEQGTREYNLALGGRRANAARDYLITQGVDATRLRTISYGKERPLEVCSTEECYAQNRRAVTVLAAGAGV
ncbi:peptidoglycan-associated lipoprotein Pal [Jannaschia aquimarina]|uniref:Peptidoglycan-associated lipoprotein n=1 Tax=Jannaschia aquimarina TaxID=935700 RepID=A0A0D1EI71_9RHOB|nr:peptidoglycan-associated lipoprotein Pal [Jannaschia aquimarina]KIT15545.1 Outer membrane lipoprotein Omp16 precursor [Jannaschia aquimarina]SNT34826.1 peptidoglycan-associated lipoprotein [Jannaschia aquimarina]